MGYLYDHRDEDSWRHDAGTCAGRPYFIRDHWKTWPNQANFECVHCWKERKRRARVLCLDAQAEQDRQRLADPSFANAVLITPYNVAVFYFAQQRALNFVRNTKAESFWIQATDSPPNWYANGYTTGELLEQKKKWSTYHARKTEGILSLLLACLDMPYRVTDSNGYEFKEYGIHNGAKGILKGWHLSEKDLERADRKEEGNLVLLELPRVLFLEMQTPMKKSYPNLPAMWFPMTPVTKYWCLDADENIDICRRGYPLVPNFSTTIDAATGQTLESAIPDLGDEFCTPSSHAAMRGYIALSRVKSADSLLIAQPFNPLLFRLGAQAWPTLLFSVLMGKVPLKELKLQCDAAALDSRLTAKLKDHTWRCSTCKQRLLWSKYFAPELDVDRDPDWQSKFSKYILRPGCLRECLACKKETVETEKNAKNTRKCALCLKCKPRKDFADSMWRHSSYATRKTVCIGCCRPECTAPDCKTCKHCRDPKCKKKNCRAPITPLHWKQLPKDSKEVASFLCRPCQEKQTEENAKALRTDEKEEKTQENFTCQLCEVPKSSVEYPPSMWTHRKTTNQRTLCFGCSHPRCVAPHCKTCKHCRDPTCRRRKCTKEIVALHPKKLPTHYAEVLSFLCDNCRYITCRTETSDGNICGKMMPKKRQQRLASSLQGTYTCGDCLTYEEHRQTLAKNRTQK